MPVKELTIEDALVDIAKLKGENKALCEKIDLLEAASKDSYNLVRELIPVVRDVNGAQVQTNRAVFSSDDPWIYVESIDFSEDSGYDLNFVQRAHALVDRALGRSGPPPALPTRCGEQGPKYWEWTKLPRFNPANKLKVTVEFIGSPGEPSV